MPAFLNWLLRLLPTNPICMRLVQGGSRRMRHLYIRSGYLVAMIVVLLFALMGSVSTTPSLRELAGAGAGMFQLVSYLQVGLICLLTPVFMAGAIAQEANPRTWDILLTTPLNNLQIVLGNIFGRLFFVLALLFSSLPLFVMTQYFGGVPGDAIFASYTIAGASALIVSAIAVTLSVTRTAGRRAVFIFYACVVMYLFVTAAGDALLRRPVAVGAQAVHTTLLTPVNPFLALEVLLRSNQYVPRDFTGESSGWIVRWWLGQPISAFCWLCGMISLVLVVFSTLRLRVIGAKAGTVPLARRIFGLPAREATERPGRTVGKNPIAWRESVARGQNLAAVAGRWGFVAVGVAIAIGLLTVYHTGLVDHEAFRMAVIAVVGAETVIIALAALNMSATAVSREREDGTLDLILTTPIQPGPYIQGKHRGLIQFLLPMLLVPTATLALIGIYVASGGLGRDGGVLVPAAPGSSLPSMPVVLPEAALAMPMVLVAFIAFCVMVGLQWSIKSKGTIGSVIGAVGIVVAVLAVVSLCGVAGGANMLTLGAVLSAASPLNLLFAVVQPETTIPSALDSSAGASSARWGLMIGALAASATYLLISYGMHVSMKRSFMFTVRKLAGTN